MDWSARQSRILTGDGRLNDFYKPPDFPFSEEELPHYHKVRGTTWEQFRRWRNEGRSNPIVAGTWTRPLFVGGWEHSDNVTGETTYNLQTPSIFLDMRIPHGTNFSRHKGFDTMSLEELRLFARRHAFCGYTLVAGEPPVATRHHAIDWNFVGGKRLRPNKWRIECRSDGKVWKEWGFAKDPFGQHVYMERWELLPDSSGPYLALRRCRPSETRGAVAAAAKRGGVGDGSDAFLLVCGDHFGYIADRPTPQPFDPAESATSSLQQLVDAAAAAAADAAAAAATAEAVAAGAAGTGGGVWERDVAREEAATARAAASGRRSKIERYLSLQACHGRVAAGRGSAPWSIDSSLQPWLEGTPLMRPSDASVAADGGSVTWRGERWEVLECTFTAAGLQALFARGRSPTLTSRL